MPTPPKTKEGEPEAKSQSQMRDMLRKVLLATIGAAAIAQEEVEALVNKLIERGEIAEKDGKSLIHEMMEKRKSKTEKIEDEVSKNVADVLKKMNIPSKADVEVLNQKITGLSKKIDELKKQP
jgi:poly(hydroxyalkanoate) granule-associated protein